MPASPKVGLSVDGTVSSSPAVVAKDIDQTASEIGVMTPDQLMHASPASKDANRIHETLPRQSDDFTSKQSLPIPPSISRPDAGAAQLKTGPTPKPSRAVDTWVNHSQTSGPLATVTYTNTLTLGTNSSTYTKHITSTLRPGAAGWAHLNLQGVRKYSYNVRYTGPIVEKAGDIVRIRWASFKYFGVSPAKMPIDDSEDKNYMGKIWSFRFEGGRVYDALDSSTAFYPSK